MADEEFELLVGESLDPFIVHLHRDALRGLTKGQRLQLEADIYGPDRFMCRHVVRAFAL